MYHIIVNPASRSGKGIIIWKEQVEPALLKKAVPYHAYFSEKAGDVAVLAAQITREAKAGPLDLIVLGGDGTVNEALQGIPDPSLIRLGYIPTGSSNDLARDLGIPKSPLAALDVILRSGSPHRLDLGVVSFHDGGKRIFAVSCGIGFDAAVCEEALHSTLKNVLNRLGLGKLTYLGIALKQLFAAKAVSCELALDGGTAVSIKKVLFVASMIHRFEGGGFQFCPDAVSDDGILNLCAVGDVPKLLVLLALPTAFWGKHYMVKGITPYRAKEVRIRTSQPLWVQTDGEVGRRCTDLSIRCLPNALTIIY